MVDGGASDDWSRETLNSSCWGSLISMRSDWVLWGCHVGMQQSRLSGSWCLYAPRVPGPGPGHRAWCLSNNYFYPTLNKLEDWQTGAGPGGGDGIRTASIPGHGPAPLRSLDSHNNGLLLLASFIETKYPERKEIISTPQNFTSTVAMSGLCSQSALWLGMSTCYYPVPHIFWL